MVEGSTKRTSGTVCTFTFNLVGLDSSWAKVCTRISSLIDCWTMMEDSCPARWWRDDDAGLFKVRFTIKWLINKKLKICCCNGPVKVKVAWNLGSH